MNKKLKLANEKADSVIQQLKETNIHYSLAKQVEVIKNCYNEIINLLKK